MTRTEDMHEHLIAQFHDKPAIYAELYALGEEMDLLDKAFIDLRDLRWIDTGQGVQLDGIGTIVGQDRQIANAVAVPFFGFFGQIGTMGFEQARFRDYGEAWLASYNLSDAEYRLVLWAKVAKNITNGTAEDTIRSLMFIFNAPTVFLWEIGNAKIRVGIGRKLEQSDILLAKAFDLFIRAGGVGIIDAVYFDYDNYFGFLGQKNAKGFEEGSFADGF